MSENSRLNQITRGEQIFPFQNLERNSVMMKQFHSFWFLSILFLGGIALIGSPRVWFPWSIMFGILLIGISGLLGTKKTKGSA